MTSSTLNYVKEMARQRAMSDDKYLKRLLYFFELKLPESMVTTPLSSTTFLFPIIIPPEAYSMDEPFTAEITPTQGGGVYVEENGIVQRMIRLRGHTGFKPRPLKTYGAAGMPSTPVPATLPADKKSYSRSLPNKPVLDGISGQRHFQYLQDSVFRTYADLKRDPATAEETKLFFHNPKDDEHWLVIPQRFSLERDSGQTFLYRYNIEMLAVDVASAVDADFSEDKNIFDKMKDGLRSAKRALDMVTGAVHDLTALQAEIKSYVNNITQILDAVTTIVNATSDFVDGHTDLIQSPLTGLESAIGLVEAANSVINSQVELGETIINFPEATIQKFRVLKDGLELMGSNPTNWETPAEATVRKLREQQDLRRITSVERQTMALGVTPTTLSEVESLGTALTYGDVLSAQGTVTAGNSVRRFKSGRIIRLTYGDTLMSLSARYLGDARLWQYIAVANGLKPPFIDTQANVPLVGSQSDGSQTSGLATGADESPFGRALGVGSEIIIPSNTNSALNLPLLPVLGSGLDQTAEVQLLGVDAALQGERNLKGTSNIQYDIPIDTEHGSVDVKLVSGLENLEQMILTRLRVEKGTDLLYQRLGMKRIIGLGITPVDLETAKFRVVEALSNDPRVAGINDIQFDYDQDIFEMECNVQIRGFSEVRSLRVLL